MRLGAAVRRVQGHFGSRLRFAFRHFPVTGIHPFAEAAEFAELAAAHGRFWEAHDRLYARQDELGFPLLADIAGRLGLPAQGLRAALARRTHAPRIRADFEGGVQSGVNGTPAFYVNGRRHDQAYDYEDLRAAIAAQLVPAWPAGGPGWDNQAQGPLLRGERSPCRPWIAN